MARPVVIRIHDRTIQEYTLPGGEVLDLIRDVSRNAKRFSIRRIHSRTGKLASSIFVAFPKPSGPYRGTGRVVANARHALWVHDGTTGPIRALHSKWLQVPKTRGPLRGAEIAWIPDNDGNRQITLKRSVRGQKANPFLRRGVKEAMRVDRRLIQRRSIG